MDNNEFASLWYPDFEGMAYAEDDEGLLLCPYFFERGKAIFVSEKIKDWNENFINITFIEVKNNEYEFVCYEQPQASRNPITFGLYRSDMDQNGGYSQFKDRFQEAMIGDILGNKTLLSGTNVLADVAYVNVTNSDIDVNVNELRYNDSIFNITSFGGYTYVDKTIPVYIAGRNNDDGGTMEQYNVTATMGYTIPGSSFNNYYTLIKQGAANYDSQGGDSDSPIFVKYVNNTAQLLGLHVGSTCTITLDNGIKMSTHDLLNERDCENADRRFKIFSPWENVVDALDIN